MADLRETARRALPEPLVAWVRRRRALQRYLDRLSRDLLRSKSSLDYVEGRLEERRDPLYEQMVRDVLERTDLILQELHRQIEAVSARTGERLEALEERSTELRRELDRLGADARAPLSD
jgi:hypothetical protein